jgi:fermentation-respiration switch protein FrsA (DUF1100 family)
MRRIVIPGPIGDIHCEQFGKPSSDAIIWFFGAGGGFGGPAGGVYIRLGEQLANEQIGSLSVDYRRPGYLQPCVADAFEAIDYLSNRGAKRILLVGHSFGGAVVIRAGVGQKAVAGVAALSSQTAGTEGVQRLSPRPLLLVHGENDVVLPVWCSRDIYRRAREPKQIIVYPGCLHGLDQCATQLDRDLMDWIRRAFAQ